MKPVFTRNFDLAGYKLPRLINQAIMARFLPMGNMAGGAGYRCLIVLFILHTVGKPVFFLLARNERYIHRLYQVIGRLRNR